MNIHKYYGVSAHNPKFIIKNAVEQDALIVCEDHILSKEVEGVARGINIPRPLSLRDIIQRLDPRIENVIFVPAEKRITNAYPDFSNAEVGDLVWSDAYGLGRIKSLTGGAPFGDIVIEFDYLHACCAVNGKYCKDSPKPTFFYSDGKGNNYLTKRPKQEIDFSTLKEGDRILVDNTRAYFIAYNPNVHFPLWVAYHRYEDGKYYTMEFVAEKRVRRMPNKC